MVVIIKRNPYFKGKSNGVHLHVDSHFQKMIIYIFMPNHFDM